MTNVRRVALILSWSISLGGPTLAIADDAPQFIVIGLFFGGFLPYILCVQVIEPWLAKRRSL